MVPTGPVARRYHDLTAHSPDSVRASGHELDWENKPFPFKVYTDIPGLHLPREIDVLATPALAAIGGEGAAPPAGLTLAALTSLLYYMAGVTKRKTYSGGGEVLFRAAASTGALYQTEVYVVAGTVEGLPPGVHHFCPGDFTLRRLRGEDARAALAEAAADATPGRRGATLVLTGLVWRNSWKYRARTYRHLFWDGGTMLANALATAAARGERAAAGADRARDAAAVAPRGGRAAGGAGPRGVGPRDARGRRPLARRPGAGADAGGRPADRAAAARPARRPRARRDDPAAVLDAQLRADAARRRRAGRRAVGDLAPRSRRCPHRAGRHLYERPRGGGPAPGHLPLSPRRPRAGSARHGRVPAPGRVPLSRAAAGRRRGRHALLSLAARRRAGGLRRARLSAREPRGGPRGRPRLPRRLRARLRRQRPHVLRRRGRAIFPAARGRRRRDLRDGARARAGRRRRRARIEHDRRADEEVVSR